MEGMNLVMAVMTHARLSNIGNVLQLGSAQSATPSVATPRGLILTRTVKMATQIQVMGVTPPVRLNLAMTALVLVPHCHHAFSTVV